MNTARTTILVLKVLRLYNCKPLTYHSLTAAWGQFEVSSQILWGLSQQNARKLYIRDDENDYSCYDLSVGSVRVLAVLKSKVDYYSMYCAIEGGFISGSASVEPQ